MVHSEVRTIFDDITKNQLSDTWISWVNAQMLYFRLSREYVTVDPGTAISVLFALSLPHYNLCYMPLPPFQK